MDLALFTRNRLKQLRLGPRNLARATRMTESYIARSLKPNSPQTSNPNDIHDQLERVLKLPQGQLAKLADLQRRECDAQAHLVSGKPHLFVRGASGFTNGTFDKWRWERKRPR